MKGFLRPLLVGGLSIAIAATSLLGSSSAALAAGLVTSWTLNGPISEGAPVFLTGTFTGGAGHGPYTVDVTWGDGTADSYSFATAQPCDPPAVCSILQVQKSNPYV